MTQEFSGHDNQRPNGPDRRALLRGGLTTAPILATLASRSAFGANSLCTKSIAMSGNLSRAMPTSCGVSPGCWKNNAAQEWWITEGPKRIQEIFDVFIDSTSESLNSRPQWRVSTPDNGVNVYKNIKSTTYFGFKGSFTEGLNGAVHAYCVLKNADGTYKSTPDNVVEIDGNGFLSQLISAALNAAFFRGSGLFGASQLYPYDLLGVVNLVNSTLPVKVTTASQAQSLANFLNSTFAATITDGYECGQIEAPKAPKTMYVPDPIA